MSRIDEIAEDLEKVVELIGEQTRIVPISGMEYQQYLWTTLRDLARCVRDIRDTKKE